MEQSGEIEIQAPFYDTPLKELEVADLQPGDFLHLKTRNGSRYIFQVIMAIEEKRFLRCIFGNPILVGASGEIYNESIKVNHKLVFGKSQSEGVNNTSSLREIIVKRDAKPHISKKEYGISVRELETNSLEIGDFINIRTKNSTYVFNIVGIDRDSDQPIAVIVGGNNNFLRDKGRIMGHVIEVGYPMRTETVDTSSVVEMVVNRNQSYEFPDPKNPFAQYEPSMKHTRVDDPEISRRSLSPYYITEQEVIEALQLEKEQMTRATLETAWLYFEHAFKEHLQSLGMIERIQEKLRFDRLKMGYKTLWNKLA